VTTASTITVVSLQVRAYLRFNMHFVASLSSLKNELLFCKVNDSSVSSADKISTFSGEIVLLAPNKLHDWRWRVALLF